MACNNHDIETVYVGYDYRHGVIEAYYAMDYETFDIAVAGGLIRKDGT